MKINLFDIKHVKKMALVAGVCAAGALVTSCIFLPDWNDGMITDKDKGTLVWSDEFDSSFNTAYWNYETGAGGWGNNEVQNYTDNGRNIEVSNGTLKIIAKKDGSSWTSARLTTKGKIHSKYGYIEARLKMPQGDSGIWPAFWMMPNDSAYGTWPRSGELDIMEYSPGTSGKQIFATVHHSTLGNEGADTYNTLGNRTDIDDKATEWHLYALKWTENYVEAFYDDVSLGVKYVNDGSGFVNWPYDKDYFVILNLAMGGNLGGPIPADMTEAVYEIDYVRWYK